MQDEKARKAGVRQRYGEPAEGAARCCGSGVTEGGTGGRYGNRVAVTPAQDGGASGQRPMADPLDTKTEELIAIGAALAANCEPCLQYHVRQGAEAGCTRDAMRRAVEIAQGVKDTPARLLANLAGRLLGSSPGAPRGDRPCEETGTHEGSPRESVDHR